MLPRSAAACRSSCSLDAGCAGFYACDRHGVARGGTYAALIGGGLSVAVLARRGLRWLVRLRSPRCGARRHVCCLDRRRPVGRRARSTRAALACTLAVATMWREAARMLPRSAAAFRSSCSLYAGCAGFYACDRHDVARGGTYAALIGGGLSVAVLALRGLRRPLRWRSPRCGANASLYGDDWSRLG